jgi:hypothetical protein
VHARLQEESTQNTPGVVGITSNCALALVALPLELHHTLISSPPAGTTATPLIDSIADTGWPAGDGQPAEPVPMVSLFPSRTKQKKSNAPPAAVGVAATRRAASTA